MNLEGIEKQVAEWHREVFPSATIQAIVNKFYEEYEEFNSTGILFTKENMEEFADMCIVYMAALNKIGLPSLSQLISDKLEINKKRIWRNEKANGGRPRVK